MAGAGINWRLTVARLGSALAVLAVLGVFFAAPCNGARQMLRGYPLGVVTGVDKTAGIISVDIGGRDGVVKGLPFIVVDAKGSQAADITAGEVYDDRFWSAPVKTEALRKVVTGMQVRWLFTPETSALLLARKTGTAAAYREFISRYPASRFIPEMIKAMPDGVLMELDPEYYNAWKAYNLAEFREYAAKHPGTGLAAAAEVEIKSIEEYDAAQEKAKKEREKKAAAYAEEQKRQEDIITRARARENMRRLEEMHGKLVNNSSDPVRFVFDQPSPLAPTVVAPGGEYELSHPVGSYTYKVYAVKQVDEFAPPVSEEETPAEPEPLTEGRADIMFDFWTVEYP